MDVQDHSRPEASKSEEEDADSIIKKMQEQNEANHFKDPRKVKPLTEIQSEAQAALDYVAPKDPFATEKKEDNHSHLIHIFESNLPQTTGVSDDINVY